MYVWLWMHLFLQTLLLWMQNVSLVGREHKHWSAHGCSGSSSWRSQMSSWMRPLWALLSAWALHSFHRTAQHIHYSDAVALLLTAPGKGLLWLLTQTINLKDLRKGFQLALLKSVDISQFIAVSVLNHFFLPPKSNKWLSTCWLDSVAGWTQIPCRLALALHIDEYGVLRALVILCNICAIYLRIMWGSLVCPFIVFFNIYSL